MRRRELAHERRKTNFAEPLATENWAACTAKKFVGQAQKRCFSTQSALSLNPLRYARKAALPRNRLKGDLALSRTRPHVLQPCEICAAFVDYNSVGEAVIADGTSKESGCRRLIPAL